MDLILDTSEPILSRRLQSAFPYDLFMTSDPNSASTLDVPDSANVNKVPTEEVPIDESLLDPEEDEDEDLPKELEEEGYADGLDFLQDGFGESSAGAFSSAAQSTSIMCVNGECKRVVSKGAAYEDSEGESKKASKLALSFDAISNGSLKANGFTDVETDENGVSTLTIETVISQVDDFDQSKNYGVGWSIQFGENTSETFLTQYTSGEWSSVNMLQAATLEQLQNTTSSVEKMEQTEGPWNATRRSFEENYMTVQASRPFNTSDGQRNLKLGETKKWLVVVYDQDGPAAISNIMELVLDNGSGDKKQGSGSGIERDWFQPPSWGKSSIFEDFFGNDPWSTRKKRLGDERKRGRKSRRNIWRNEIDFEDPFRGFDSFTKDFFGRQNSMFDNFEKRHQEMVKRMHQTIREKTKRMMNHRFDFDDISNGRFDAPLAEY